MNLSCFSLQSPMHDRPKSFGTQGLAGSPLYPSRKLFHDISTTSKDDVPPIPNRRGRHAVSPPSSSDCMLFTRYIACLVSCIHTYVHAVIPRPSPSMSRLNPANITSWSVDDVSQWLLTNGLGQFIEVFRDNCVDGECMLTLDNNLLKDDLNITQLGYRSKIIKRVEALKMTQYCDQQLSSS